MRLETDRRNSANAATRWIDLVTDHAEQVILTRMVIADDDTYDIAVDCVLLSNSGDEIHKFRIDTYRRSQSDTAKQCAIELAVRYGLRMLWADPDYGWRVGYDPDDANLIDRDKRRY